MRTISSRLPRYRPPRLAGQTAWNAVGQLAPRVGQLLVTPVTVTTLGLERYGAWALIWMTVSLLASFDGGIGGTLTWLFARKQTAGDRDAISRVLCAVTIGFVLVAAAVAGLAALGARSIAAAADLDAGAGREAVAVAPIVGPLLAVIWFNSATAALQNAAGRFREVAISNVVRVVIVSTGTVHLLYAGHGIAALLWLQVVAFAVVATARLLRCAREGMIGWPSRLTLSVDERRELVGYGWRMQVLSLTVLVNVQFDAWIIAALFGLEVVGAYSIAVTVAQAVRYVPIYALQPMTVALTREAQAHGRVGALAAHERLNRLWLRAVSAFAVVFIIVIGPAIEVWLGPGHAAASRLATIIFIGYGINLLTGCSTTLVRALGEPGHETRYGLIATGVNVLLTVPLAITSGAEGIVTASAIASLIGSIYFLRRMKDTLDLTIRSQLGHLALGPLVTVAAGALAIRQWWPREPTGPVALGLLGLALIALGGIYVVMSRLRGHSNVGAAPSSS